MPALVVVAEVADGRADGFLAVMALGHWLHALVAVEVSIHHEVLLPSKILSASLANKALFMPAFALGGDFLGAESNNLFALLAFLCVLIEAPFADSSLVHHAKCFLVDRSVAVSAGKMIAVPVFVLGFSVCRGENQLQG